MIEVEEMEIGTTVDVVGTTFAADGHHLQDVTTTVQDRIRIIEIEAITTPLAGSDLGHLTAIDDRIRTDTEVRARMDVAVKTRRAINSIFLDATEATSLMFRFL